ncbi:MAG: glutamate synthase subunit beta [Planctomycetota bacterium]
MPLTTAAQPDASAMPMRDPTLRLNDFYEVYERPDPRQVRGEASRCMNCGAAFCVPEGGYLGNDGAAAGCPISNKIPEWNRLVELGRWRDAYDRLALTNNFPEFTARVCPAPCQDSCIVGIHDRPVGIKFVERAIIDRAFDEGWVEPRTPTSRTGRRIAIVGSGPAGLAAADQLNALGHVVTVYERSDTPGGLLTYGIPSMKLDKAVVARRIALMEAAGVRFEVGCDVGRDLNAAQLAANHHATLLAVGALAGRDLYLPGRESAGITLAMPYLEASTRAQRQNADPPQHLHALGKRVVVIGGGDTGTDCIGTALRQSALSVVNVTRRQIPGLQRSDKTPWPGPSDTYALDYAHAEGQRRDGQDPRRFGVQPLAFLRRSNGHVAGLRVRTTHKDGRQTTQDLAADMVILSIGFTGSDAGPLLDAFGFRGTHPQPTPGVFVAGDAWRGPSLVVHAIAEGREIADTMNRYLQPIS